VHCAQTTCLCFPSKPGRCVWDNDPKWQLQLLWLLLLLYTAAKRDRYVHDGAAVCCLLQLKRMSVVVAVVAVDVADVVDIGAAVVAAVAETASDILADTAQSLCFLTCASRALAGTL
jgi:hypothetical protein